MKKLSDRQLYERTLTEEDVVGQIRSFLELNGARVHRIVERIPWGRKTSTPGIPDIIGWMPRGRSTGNEINPFLGSAKSFYIEVKRPGGKRRPAQTTWISDAVNDGVLAFFAESVDDVVNAFASHGIYLRGIK